jgi:serine/threonine-protein kinase
MTQINQSTTAEEDSVRRDASALSRIRLWSLVELAWEGPLTQVYRARPADAAPSFPPAYALKVLKPEWQNNPQAIGLLRRECLVGRQVSHPHLISILAAGVSEAPYFVVMPWLAGRTLADQLSRQSPVDPPSAFWIARQVAEAVGALHESGWMHGDIKPENVFCSPEGHTTLLDLGFARRADRIEKSLERCVTGTWNYMSPEVAAGTMRVDARSDLYSLGVVLFEMLTGRMPFEGRTPEDMARQHREARPPQLEPLVSSLPADAYRLVRQMLAKEPLRRPPPREAIARLASLEIATFARRQIAG